MGEIEERIRRSAADLGFVLCGIARVQPLPHADFVTDWVAGGYDAGMAYIGRGLEKRLDPTRLLENARSVISLGYPYRPPVLPAIDWRKELRGRIAAYALGADYHKVIEKKLRSLAASIRESLPQAGLRPYVDAGPVLEREWAAAAGVGWFGKNTNLLHRRQGSWFFLAELLCDLALEPDPPTSDHCGRCSSCLDLCPTGALKPGYLLDARLCISYWTIEHRGTIPREIRPQLGPWVFGCDVCQDVCPWNGKYSRDHPGEVEAALMPSLADLLLQEEETFRERFRGTAVLRTRREGLARNAAIVLGNSGNPSAVGLLQQALRRDPSPVVRGHAAWALGCLGGGDPLREAARNEADPTVREELVAALAACG